MEMTGRKLLFLLAFGVLMGAFAGASIAEAQGMDAYGPWDQSLSAEQENTVGRAQEGESREPMETGSVPDQPGSWFERNLNTQGGEAASGEPSGQEEADFGGQAYRRGIDSP